MERSESQKIVRVLSIIDIVAAVLYMIMGIMVIAGGALMLGASTGAAGAEVIAEGLTTADVGGMASFAGIGVFVAGAVELAVGLLGLRASNDASKIMPVWVLSLISLVGQVVGFIMGIVQGTAMNGLLSSIVSLALAALMFWAANNVKAEAGK